MKIASLDNEVHFKNVFTDVEIFTAFVKDVLGIEIIIDKVETEKILPSKVSAVKFRMDLFAEDKNKRTIVEIQKVDYDYAYDRFSHYFYANLVDLQKSSQDYSYEKDVYVIVVVTSAYKIKNKNGELLRDDVLITDTNPRTLKGDKRYMHNHKLVMLNAIHADDDTPKAIKDWLDLIVESMKEEQDLSNINTDNPAINKAVNRASVDDLTPEERAESKIQYMRKRMIALKEYEAKEEGIEEGTQKTKVAAVLRLHKNGVAIPIIADSLDMTEAEVEAIIREADGEN